MANMSYCRFENTYRDLIDCLNALGSSGVDTLSNEELQYANRMMEICQNMLDYEDEITD